MCLVQIGQCIFVVISSSLHAISDFTAIFL